MVHIQSLPLLLVADNHSTETTWSHLCTLLMSLHQYLAHAMSLMMKTCIWTVPLHAPFDFDAIPASSTSLAYKSKLEVDLHGVLVWLPHLSSTSLTCKSELGVDLMVFQSCSHILHKSYRRHVYVVLMLFPHHLPHMQSTSNLRCHCMWSNLGYFFQLEIALIYIYICHN